MEYYGIIEGSFSRDINMKKAGRPKGSTKAVIAFRRALQHSLAETEKRAMDGDHSAQETLINLAAAEPSTLKSILPSAA